MLIYNSKKEFLGIDENDLLTLGFSNLLELKTKVDDFADMFVKTPGFIHNFKHVNWIDFVACADPQNNSKVIINTGNKNFRCNIEVKTIFLNDNPSSKAFLVYLNNILEVNAQFDEPKEIHPNKNLDNTVENIIDKDFELDIDKKTPKENFTANEEKVIKEKEKETFIQMQIFDNGYYYDPEIASSELGLPVELIEEFIEDFIAQANEFKIPLYNSLDNNDTDTLKSLSHKLKGVAANLRIEDAFETLTIVNTSDNNNEITSNLDIFYNIISKLSNKKIAITKEKLINKVQIEEDDDDLVLTFKDEKINDSDVPQKIEMPELADDEFLNPDSEDKIEADNSIDIENISDEEIIS